MAKISDVIRSLKKKASEFATNSAKDIYDDKGVFRQGQFQPLRPLQERATQAVNQRVIQPTIQRARTSLASQNISTPQQFANKLFNPQTFQQTVVKPYQNTPISFPANYVANKGSNILSGLQAPFNNKPLLQKAGDVLGAIGTVARPVQTAQFEAMSPVFNAGSSLFFNKRLPTIQEAKQNFYESQKTAPKIAAISAVTNPLIEKVVGKVSPLVKNSLGNFTLNRLSTGAFNIPEGMAMSAASGQQYGAGQAATDFLMGAITGSQKPTGKLTVKGSVGNRPKNIDAEDLGLADSIKDFFKSANKDTNPKSINDAKTIIDDLAGKYLTKQEVDKVRSKGAKTNDKFYEQLNDAIRTKFRDQTSSMNYASNLNLGFVEKGKPQQAGEVLKDMKVGQTLEPEMPKGEVKQTFRVDKFNVDEETQNMLVDLQQRLGLNSRKVQSFDDMKVIAQELGTTPQKLIKDIENKRITAGEVVALGDTISTSSQRIMDLTEQLKNNPNDITIKNALEAEESFINQAIKKRITGGTEAGRAVVAFKIIANKTLDPTFWLEKAKRRLGEKKDLSPEQIGVINDLIANKDRLGLATFIARLGESSFAEKVVTLWKAGLLTGFRTQEANVISNAAFGALETIKDIPATGFDMARSMVTGGNRAKALTLRGVTSQGEGLVTGTKKGIEYVKNGIDPWDADKAEMFTPTRYGDTPGGRLAQAYTDFIFRSLGATDRPFREAAFNRSLSEQATLKGINEKLTVDQIDNILKNPTKEMLEAAKEDALQATFNKDNKLSDAIRAGKRAGGPAVETAIDVVAPFTRTPTNVAEALFDYTPAGIIKDTVKKIINKESITDKRLAESFGRSVTGTAILWAGYELAKNGLMSGSRPASEAQRSQRDLEGKTDNSILVNGKWMSLGRVSPIGNLLLLGAAHYQNGGNIAATAVEGVKSITEQTFLKGASSALKAVNEPDRFASSFVDNAIAGFIPSLINDVGRATDKNVRAVDGLRQRLKSRVPGLRQQLPIKPNALGEDTTQQGGLSAMFDPFNSRTATNDPLVQEMKRVGYNLNVVGDTLNDEKLTQAQQIEYQKRAGKYIKEFLPQVINAEGYKDLDLETQKSIIEKTVIKAKDVAREEIKPILDTIQSQEKSIFPEVGAAEIEQKDPETKPMGDVFSSGSSAIKKINPNSITTTATASDKKKAMYIYTDPDTLTTQTLNLTKVFAMPDKTSTDKLKKENESYKMVDKALNSALSETQKNEIIKNLGLKNEEVKYYLNAKEPEDIKLAMIQDKMSSYKSQESFVSDLKSWRREVNGSIFATDSLLKDLKDNGDISDAEYKAIKAIKYNKITGDLEKSKGTGKKLKIKSPPKMGTINIKAPTVQKVSISGGLSTLAKNNINNSKSSFKIRKALKLNLKKLTLKV